MLQDACFLAIVAVDTAENQPSEVSRKGAGAVHMRGDRGHSACNGNEKRLENGPMLDSSENFFEKQYEKRKVCFDCAGVGKLHMSPSRGRLSATQNS